MLLHKIRRNLRKEEGEEREEGSYNIVEFISMKLIKSILKIFLKTNNKNHTTP